MTPREQLDYIIIELNAFQQNVGCLINQTKYRVKEELQIKNVDEIIESLSEKIEQFCEIHLRDILSKDGSIPHPEVVNVDKIIDSMLKKIQQLLKLHFEGIIKTQSEQNKK